MNDRYLFLAVIFILLWLIGLTDLYKHIRKTKNRKRDWAVFFAVGSAQLLMGVFWGVFLLLESPIAAVENTVTGIQNHGWLFLTIIFGCIVGIWVLGWNIFNDHLSFRLTTTLILLIGFLFLLFANGPIDSIWRSWSALLFFFFLGTETILQLIAIPGWLPSHPTFLAGMYHQYGRIYQKQEGFSNTRLNRYGLHQPDANVNFDPNVRRIVIIGGSYLQGYQVAKNEHLAAQLEQLIEKESSRDTQVFALGMPDFGIGVYMHDLLFDVFIEKFQPDEVIFFLHASSDFQSESSKLRELYLYDLVDGVAELREEDARLRHALQHFVIRGYHDQFDPLRLIKTHLLLPKLVHALMGAGSRLPFAQPTDSPDAISTFAASIIRKIKGKPYYYQDFVAVPSIHADGHRNFLFEKEPNDDAKKSFAVTRSLYHQIFDYLRAKNIEAKLVTIPALSARFFTQGDHWSTMVGEFDLMATERVAQGLAGSQKVPFLGMLEQFARDQLTLSRIQSFFFDDGKGHLTPKGNRYFAEKVFSAFYAPRNAFLKNGETKG